MAVLLLRCCCAVAMLMLCLVGEEEEGEIMDVVDVGGGGWWWCYWAVAVLAEGYEGGVRVERGVVQAWCKRGASRDFLCIPTKEK